MTSTTTQSRAHERMTAIESRLKETHAKLDLLVAQAMAMPEECTIEQLKAQWAKVEREGREAIAKADRLIARLQEQSGSGRPEPVSELPQPPRP